MTNNQGGQRCLLLLFLVISLCITGCGGGMVGTGTGPDDRIVYTLDSLPPRIGINNPAPLINERLLADGILRRERMTSPGDPAMGWELLNQNITQVEAVRLVSEEVLVHIDTVFDAIVSLCNTQSVASGSDCTLPAGSFSGIYNEAIVARISAVYENARVSDTNNSEQTSLQADLNEELQARIGSRYEFGAVTLRIGDGQPYDYDLETTLASVLPSDSIRIRWNSERTVSETTLKRSTGGIAQTQYLGFATNLPGERFTYTRNEAVGAAISTSFDVSIVAGNTPERRVLVNALVSTRTGTIRNEIKLDAQVDNSGGFVTSHTYSNVNDVIVGVSVVRETFASNGILLAGDECESSVLLNACSVDTNFTPFGDGQTALTDSNLFATLEQFNSLERLQDPIRWTVRNLPSGVESFLVLDADNSVPLAQRDLLCSGIQFTQADVQLFCTAPDARLNTAVVAITALPSGKRQLVPDARVTTVGQ